MSYEVDDTTGLARLFHLNSEPWQNERWSPHTPFLQKAKNYVEADRVALPETSALAVDELAASRKSERAFQDEPLALEHLAALLRSGYGVLPFDGSQGRPKVLRRSVPSAGGLYPLEIYLLVRNVKGLVKGIYHYDSIGDELEILCEGPWEDQASDAFLTWSFVETAPVIFCLGAVFERTQSKYGPRGYRYVLLEAGHVSQNLCIAAAERNLSSLCMGGYHDNIINKILKLDGLREAIVYAVAFGEKKAG